MMQLELFPGDDTPQAGGPGSPPSEGSDIAPAGTDPSTLRELLHAWKGEFVAWCSTLLSAGVYAVLIVTFVFQVARVEGHSMAPTLEDQDRLVVDKVTYRFTDPHRQDIVMLLYPVNPDLSFVKRVIAEEGDTVRIEDGHVFVNDLPAPEGFIPAEYRSHDSYGPARVPPGYYFVLGDHRKNSSDSRDWQFVPKKYIVGKIRLRWWPTGRARIF